MKFGRKYKLNTMETKRISHRGTKLIWLLTFMMADLKILKHEDCKELSRAWVGYNLEKVMKRHETSN